MKTTFSVPIYYTKHYVTKSDKSWFVGLNWYRNAQFHEQNEVKKFYHDHLNTVNFGSMKFVQFKLSIAFYFKNPACDGHNVTIVEKFILDGLQDLEVIPQDNVKHHLGTSWYVAGQDKDNPRCEITIISVP